MYKGFQLQPCEPISPACGLILNCNVYMHCTFVNCYRPMVHFFFHRQVSSIEQEILSLINRVSHPNLTHYLAVNVQESAPTVNVQVMSSRYSIL